MSQPPLSESMCLLPSQGFADAGLAASMCELNAGNCTVMLQEASDTSKRLNMLVQIDAAVGGADPAFRRNGSGFDHHQPSAAYGTGAEMDEMPIVREAIVRRILTHRRDSDAVSQDNIFQTKFLKQNRHYRFLLVNKLARIDHSGNFA